MREGEEVTYVGPDTEGLRTGDVGTLMMLASATAAHVQAPNQGIYLVDVYDLAPATASRTVDPLADSLEFGGLTTFATRQVYDLGGSTGVINAMAQAGHLTGFGDIAEEALALVASRIRQDPSFRAVTASLEDEEAEDVLRTAAASLIVDAFGDVQA